jgi:regulator of cell morphogenesis and NO signaling
MTKTVREVALENPAAARVLERLGIDDCCGGRQTLEEACQAAQLNIDEVVDSLELAERELRASQVDRNWGQEPLSELIAHIQGTHHKFTRTEIERLGPLFDKVCSVHGKNHPELLEVRSIFQGLAQELTHHLMKEEMVLFPHVIRMEEAMLEKAPVVPPPFGTVQNPIFMMEHEHDSAGEALRAMRKATKDYTAPEEACVSYLVLYQALGEFESDLHRHIHLENNLLFSARSGYGTSRQIANPAAHRASGGQRNFGHAHSFAASLDWDPGGRGVTCLVVRYRIRRASGNF